MSKPEDIPQDVWLTALATQRDLFGNRAECISLSEFDENTETIARAILSAEKRGEEREREREACAVAAEERHRIWGTTVQVQGIEVEDDISACAEIAAAIRARGA